jgi:hypothetical protein
MIYLSEGHVIFSMSHAFYNTYFLGKAACFPIIPDEDASYTIQYGSIEKGNSTIFSDHIENFRKKDMYTCKLSPLMLETEKGIMSTCFYHDKAGNVQGVALDKKFIDGLMEFLPSRNTPLECLSPKDPVCYFSEYFDIIILPININPDSDLAELIKSMNSEAIYRRKLKEAGIAI